MSIINEALKKAQDENKQIPKGTIEPVSNIEARPKIIPPQPKKGKKFIFFSFIIILIVGGIIFLKNFLFISPIPSQEAPPSQQTPNLTVPTPSASTFPRGNLSLPRLILNGIVYDEQRPYAIVNNKVLLKGDVIEGATLVEINQDKVKLIFNDEEIELTAK